VIELITIGDELTSGRTADANAAMIARALHAAGFAVRRITTVGDAPADISAALRTCLPATRFVVVTGGLGPTEDDRTAAAAADALNDTLALHPEALAMLREKLERRGRTMNAPQQKQALLPSTCTLIANPVGTACGFIMGHENRHYLFLPGVPAEARAMTEAFVVDYINKESGRGHAILSMQLRLFGLWESRIQEELTGLPDPLSGVSLGYYPHFPEVILRLTAHGPDAAVLEERIERARDAIVSRIGGHVYAEDDASLMETVGALLANAGSSVSVAESCTGGLLCHLITGVPGSSNWFERGLVVYSNAAKMQLAGVEGTVIAQHGAVSAPVAQALAQGIRKRSASTWGIGIKSIAGPGGGTPEKPVGTVFFAIAGPDGCRVHQRRFTGTRDQIKMLSAFTALDLLRRTLLGLPAEVQQGLSQ